MLELAITKFSVIFVVKGLGAISQDTVYISLTQAAWKMWSEIITSMTQVIAVALMMLALTPKYRGHTRTLFTAWMVVEGVKDVSGIRSEHRPLK